MRMNNKLAFIFFITLFALSACSIQQNKEIKITAVKVAEGIDEELMPVNVTKNFAKGTQKVFCWFKWENAQKNVNIVAKWHYVTDDIHILNYAFEIPRKEGTGSVSLVMPKGKKLPSGEYKVDLTIEEQILKTRTFEVK